MIAPRSARRFYLTRLQLNLGVRPIQPAPLQNQGRYSVAIVVDPDFGARLRELAARLHVWAVDTPANRSVGEPIQRELDGFHFDKGVTLFRAAMKSREQDVADIIANVDTHHGESSHVPAVSVLEVYGSTASPELRRVFARYGFTHIVDGEDAFQAISRLSKRDDG
jgi:hypothetical protein